MIAIGVGDAITRQELESVASFPVMRNVMMMENYNTLFFVEDYLVKTICDSEYL